MNAQPPSIEVAMLPPANSGRRAGIAVAVVVSAAVHLVLFALVLNHFAGARGGDGHLLDAIEIEVVDAMARESVTPRTDVGGGLSAATDMGGAQRQTQATAGAQTATSTTADALESDTVAYADMTAAPKTDADARHETIVQPSPTASAGIATGAVTAVASAEAGASSTADAPAVQPGSAASSASPGAVARFNAEVRKALGRSRPRGWPAGHLLLAFSVSDAGRVENAKLTQQSASRRLNQLTLDWIVTVDMPVPPQGLPSAERRYSIPITVR